jgi:hypothetical protein
MVCLKRWDGACQLEMEKLKFPFEIVDTFQHFITTNTFIVAFQATIGHWYYIGVV